MEADTEHAPTRNVFNLLKQGMTDQQREEAARAGVDAARADLDTAMGEYDSLRRENMLVMSQRVMQIVAQPQLGQLVLQLSSMSRLYGRVGHSDPQKRVRQADSAYVCAKRPIHGKGARDAPRHSHRTQSVSIISLVPRSCRLLARLGKALPDQCHHADHHNLQGLLCGRCGQEQTARAKFAVACRRSLRTHMFHAARHHSHQSCDARTHAVCAHARSPMHACMQASGTHTVRTHARGLHARTRIDR
eukprot:6213042-Pleurochrysis_carterae.AAC.2